MTKEKETPIESLERIAIVKTLGDFKGLKRGNLIRVDMLRIGFLGESYYMDRKFGRLYQFDNTRKRFSFVGVDFPYDDDCNYGFDFENPEKELYKCGSLKVDGTDKILKDFARRRRKYLAGVSEEEYQRQLLGIDKDIKIGRIKNLLTMELPDKIENEYSGWFEEIIKREKAKFIERSMGEK